jgi:mono/diheme cytochrome c family protein
MKLDRAAILTSTNSKRIAMRNVIPTVAVGFGILLATAVGVAATAQDASGTAPRNAGPSVYAPVTSDLMNDVIQPRHIKLWLAGKSRNWVYADYERHNIGGALARMAAAIPTYKGTANADLIAAFATPPLADLDAAIKAKNETAFATAYRALTTGCNGCHQATGHEMVVIKVPDSDPFPDQDFGPHKP